VKLSIEQQKLADAIMPFTDSVNGGGSTRFIIEQLIDRYWLDIVLNFHDIPDDRQENILHALREYFAGLERSTCCLGGHADGCECHYGAKPKLAKF
jgi:hypothetical protein